MLNGVGAILYHVLVVLFPILFYHLFFNENRIQRKEPTSALTLLLMAMVLLTMSVPITISPGHDFDFRVIPIIISFFYGGTIPGIMTLGTMMLYQFTIELEAFYVCMINYSIASSILMYFSRRFENMEKKYKVAIVSIIFWVIALTRFIALYVKNQPGDLAFIFLLAAVTWVTLILVVFLIENLNQQMEIRKELARADKLNMISQLAASVAHEVRNPMTSVRGFLQLMSQDKNLNSSQRNYISISLNELDTAHNIINDYLSLAKPHTEGLIPINISNEVKNTVELMTSYSTILNITIKTTIQESLFIKGNKDEIKQVLVNIMKNGIEAMDNQGCLIVRVFEENENVLIEIIDNGKGMSKSQLKTLGTPFYSTKEKGTGVGLTISFQLIEAMKGKILVQSEAGYGTKFIIKFPAIKVNKDNNSD
ncbi:sporulation kinase [Bacillus sp. M6-12]|uniref:ATP-binding protein n=1 Tax=Bacillus sp. M6-12 TaxID=2054166 RepID=UPI000C792996|nr:ATP-binding protein [Bacillus sp. M6-12]PLS18314.1 sporulation kinase [Bacillus sp. M6-12]